MTCRQVVSACPKRPFMGLVTAIRRALPRLSANCSFASLLISAGRVAEKRTQRQDLGSREGRQRLERFCVSWAKKDGSFHGISCTTTFRPRNAEIHILVPSPRPRFCGLRVQRGSCQAQTPEPIACYAVGFGKVQCRAIPGSGGNRNETASCPSPLGDEQPAVPPQAILHPRTS